VKDLQGEIIVQDKSVAVFSYVVSEIDILRKTNSTHATVMTQAHIL